jgi:hypothetical protein
VANASVEIIKLSFDFTDEQVTEVEIVIKGHGDVPHQLISAVKKKGFPARMSAVDILQGPIAKMEYLYW